LPDCINSNKSARLASVELDDLHDKLFGTNSLLLSFSGFEGELYEWLECVQSSERRMATSPSTPDKNLVVLGCSATKVEVSGVLPAIHRYDGPAFRVLRSFLRDYRWPDTLSIAVLSAKFGLIGGLAHIPNYNKRMTPELANKLNASVTASFQKLREHHSNVELVMGKDYLGSINLDTPSLSGTTFHFAPGAIGMKLNHLHGLLRAMPHEQRAIRPELDRPRRPLYFLPDWDDFLDVDYDFAKDKFSSLKRSTRNEEHSIAMMRPQRLCDGVLVSLAQNLGTKGLLKRVDKISSDALAPRSVRAHFKLENSQWAFGDCGAFSYVNEDKPTISVEQAVALYDLHEFDFGASVDHIPIPEIQRDGKKHTLTEAERRQRVRLTKRNAERFINLHRATGANFVPVGVIQGVDANDFGPQLAEYVDMGYSHIALGGLVPRSDAEVLEIVEVVSKRTRQLRQAPWIHLLGVFRPALQEKFRELGINSFDSATYFRKAWLRSGQNYLGTDGKWYAAIRVPPTTDARTMIRLKESGVSERRLKTLERKALAALTAYDIGAASLTWCLRNVLAYDSLLVRNETEEKDIAEAYRKTLEAKPWNTCTCQVCRSIGINALIFRGLNRNKRRGAHNTLQLFQKIGG